MNKTGVAVMAMGAAALLSVSACDRVSHKNDNNRFGRGDRAEMKAERRAERMNERNGGDYDNGGGGSVADAPAYKDGKPIWASNKRRSAQDNIDKMFRRNGADFGASSADDYVAKAHAFMNTPPRGVQTATRSNGDKLFYDPASNTFLVVTRKGAPRIMMKPRDGKSYWTEQLANLDRKGGYGQGGGKGGKNRGGYERADRDGGSDDNG